MASFLPFLSKQILVLDPTINPILSTPALDNFVHLPGIPPPSPTHITFLPVGEFACPLFSVWVCSLLSLVLLLGVMPDWLKTVSVSYPSLATLKNEQSRDRDKGKYLMEHLWKKNLSIFSWRYWGECFLFPTRWDKDRSAWRSASSHLWL